MHISGITAKTTAAAMIPIQNIDMTRLSRMNYCNVKLISAQLRFKINPQPRENNSDSKRNNNEN